MTFAIHAATGLVLRTGYKAPPEDHDFGGLPKFGAAPGVSIMDPSQWRDTDLGIGRLPVWYQVQNGCVGHGGGSAFWLAFLLAGGTVPDGGFSPTDLYAQVNHGIDQGAYVSESMTALMRNGIGLMADVPESVYFESQIPASARAKRSRFRVSDAYHTGTFEAIGTALQLGYPVSFGISLPWGYEAVGPDGIMPRTALRPDRGHCMCAYGTTRLRSGEPAIRVRNSWGTRWGNRGNCLMVKYHFGERCDAFAIRAAASDPQDPNPAPAVA